MAFNRSADGFAELADGFSRMGAAMDRAYETLHLLAIKCRGDERRAYKRDPGLAEAIRFEREYFNPGAGWLDVASARESGRVRHPLVRSAR